MVHLSGTASASDLACLECELWQMRNGIWNPEVLPYNGLIMCFVRAGSWFHLSDTASASDLARLEMVGGWLLVGCWLVAGWLLVACWLLVGCFRLLAGH